MGGNKREPEDVNPEIAADIADATSAGAGIPSGEEDAMELMAALTKCQQELAETRNAYLRAHADFDNFRKRLRAERDQEFARGSDRVLSDLLTITDDFERALTAMKGNQTPDATLKGIDLIYRQFASLLERYGVKAMEAEGKPFDPKYHDAVARMATTAAPEHTIIGVVQKGYLKNGEVFRPAKVAVAVLPEEPME